MTIVALAGVLILLGLTVFQLLLILGKPLGDFAWGGQHKVLPKNLRIASVSSIILYIIFAVFLLSKSGIFEIVAWQPLLDTSMWIFTAYFTLGIFMNLISRNKKERYLMTPVVLVLAVIFFITTIS